MTRNSVGAGYCGWEYGCVFEKTECPDVTTFRSSHEMKYTAGAHGGNCLSQKIVKAKKLGQCADSTCSPNTASCPGSDSSFTIDSKTCSVEETKFGSCGSRCSWSPDDCLDSELWTFPSENCSCDKVQVGGCLKSDKISCAVTSLGCDAASTWLKPLEVAPSTGNSCFLCSENSPYGAAVNHNRKPNTTESSESSTSKMPIIVGSIVGGILVSSAIAILAVIHIRRTKKGMEKITLPPQTIATFGSGDDASVL